MINTLIVSIGLVAAALPSVTTSIPSPLRAEMQRLESTRNAAIKIGDMTTLERIYAPDFRGISASGEQIDRRNLFLIFEANMGKNFTVESEVLTARLIGGVVVAEGRLRLFTSDRGVMISDTLFLHVFRRKTGRWEMIAGSATPAPRMPEAAP
jgi:hypothetical protein